MDPATMLLTAVILFTLAALGGVTMAAIRFGGHRNPPAWLAMLHGLLAAAGITLLAYATFSAVVPGTAQLALLLFVVAAAGGGILSLAYKWRQKLLPGWLVAVHAAAAVVAYLLLLVAVLA